MDPAAAGIGEAEAGVAVSSARAVEALADGRPCGGSHQRGLVGSGLQPGECGVDDAHDHAAERGTHCCPCCLCLRASEVTTFTNPSPRMGRRLVTTRLRVGLRLTWTGSPAPIITPSSCFGATGHRWPGAPAVGLVGDMCAANRTTGCGCQPGESLSPAQARSAVKSAAAWSAS